jgi:uncharacterized membrane protein
MKFRFLTKVNNHKKFNFTPRYYDERKERLDSMVESYARLDKKQEHQQLENEENSEFDFRRKEAMKLSMSDNWGRGKNKAKDVRKSNIRVLLILLSILILGYLVFRTSTKTPENEVIIYKID